MAVIRQDVEFHVGSQAMRQFLNFIDRAERVVGARDQQQGQRVAIQELEAVAVQR